VRDLLVRLGSRMLGKREILLGGMGGSLGAYVIGLLREHQSSTEEGLTLWERLECYLVSLEPGNISVALGSSGRHTHGPKS
jgi:hypothetical protein